MQLKQYKFEKVETSSKNWELPTEKKYFFETGIRRAIMIKPIWTTWKHQQAPGKEEEVYQLEIICIYSSWENKIVVYLIQVEEIEELYYSTNKNDEADLIKALINGDLLTRSKEKFMEDYNKFFNKTNLILE